MELNLVKNNVATSLLVEKSAFAGVKKIAEAVAEDIRLVTDCKPQILDRDSCKSGLGEDAALILCATVGKSEFLEQMEQSGVFTAAEIKGKREVYKIALVEKPFEGVSKALVICGSDKRGTIYGMFALSEYIGVTPLVYLGDAAPAKNPEIVIGKDIEIVSKEPSVRYRGFFINDEWPCFGNWAHSHFGGVNADMYQHVFEFLLRMKGNYFWPAMWASNFPLDGPGSANEELADMYGVVMGYSHHEPCLRSSEEWDLVRGEGTKYGNEWNFYTNEQGLLNYWTDSLKRSGKYENIITIGMRGERDSSMLGENATVKENVELLKDIIRKQRQLIRENVDKDFEQVPQMLALYKEVEAYFYGDEEVEGLKDWDGLDGVICMLCEDNFGHMRTLPTEEARNHKGGFGMYYHFDYHGGPISYEWVDSTPLSKTWEQMCNAYEYGIRDLWIVNVGDLKFHEVPLTYFMALAYDYDKWGVSNPNSYREYTAQWAKKCFPEATEDIQNKAAKVLNGYIEMNHMRRPESLNENIYHPCHFLEADKMITMADEIQKLNREVYEKLPQSEKNGYYSMVGYSAYVSANLLKMHLYAGKSALYSKQGRPAANTYALAAADCIEFDKKAKAEFAEFLDGKWKSMELASHIGFTKWNDDGCRYPVISYLHPCEKNRMSVSRKDEMRVCFKNYGAPDRLFVPDFLDEGVNKVILELTNDGSDLEHPLTYHISVQGGEMPAWLSVSPMEGKLQAWDQKQAWDKQNREKKQETTIEEVVLTCDREKLPAVPEKCTLLISDGDTTVAVEVQGSKMQTDGFPTMTFLPKHGVITMNACHYAENKGVATGEFKLIQHYGQYESAMKVFPATKFYEIGDEKPELTYRFYLSKAGEYQVELLAAPTNPAYNGTEIRAVVTGCGEQKIFTLADKNFRGGNTGDPVWCKGVLDQIHKASASFRFEEGVQEITVSPLEAGVVLERIRIIPVGYNMPQSYLGPEESAFVE